MGIRSNRLGEAVLTSTHTLCFGAKIRQIGIPLLTPFFYIKVGYEGVYISWTCFPDGVTLPSFNNKFAIEVQDD